MPPGPALNDPPLHDAGVFASRGDEVAVVTEEVDIGDVTAVPTVHVAGSLGRKTRRELNANSVELEKAGILHSLLHSFPLPLFHSSHLCSGDTGGTHIQPHGVPAHRESGLVGQLTALG